MARQSLLAGPAGTALYRALFGNRSSKLVKLIPWTAICVLLFLRSAGQFARHLLGALAAVAVVASAVGALRTLQVLGAVGAVGYVALLGYLLHHPDQNAGHRAGAEGYEGEYFENSIEALEDLVRRDRGPEGPLKGFPYVEIDVQDTADGAVVVFHDDNLLRAIPPVSPNLEELQGLATKGVDVTQCRVKDLSLEQIRALSLGGRRGCTIPTLEEFLTACVRLELHRPLAVEVKLLHSERARTELLRLLR